MAGNKIFALKEIKIACRDCGMEQLCLPAGLERDDMQCLDKLVTNRRVLQRGEALIKSGQRFASIYALRSGCLKSFSVTESGDEQVTGFHLPGELLGIDAIYAEVHSFSCEALDTSSVCEIPFERLQNLTEEIPGLNAHFLRIMSKEICHGENKLLQLSRKNASGRLAVFLLSLSERFGERNLSIREFNMSMSRQDIASYLNLAIETVSRTLTRFQSVGILRVQGRNIRIEDISRLRELAGQPANGDSTGLSCTA